MRSKKKAIVLGVTGGVAALAMAACSSSSPKASANNSTTPSGSAGGGSTAATGSASPSSASGGKVVNLSLWYGLGGTLGANVQSFITAFNASHPNIHVTGTYQGSYSGGGPEQQKLLAAIAAGDPPDMAQLEVNSMPAFKSALRPITDLMNSSTDTKPSDFLPGVLTSTKFGNDYYAVPWNRSVPVIIYNATMLKAHGINTAPATWEDLQKDAAAVSSGSGATKVTGFAPIAQWWFWEAETTSGGGQILSDDLKTAQFTTDQALYVPKLVQQMMKDGSAKAINSNDEFGDTIAAFAKGQIAIFDDTNSNLSSVGKAVAGKFDWEVAPYPHAQGHPGAIPPGGADVAMFKAMPQSKVAAAWTFMQWLDETAQTVKWSESTGYVPVKQSALEDSGYKAFLTSHPQFAVPVSALKDEIAPPATSNYYGILEYAQDAMTKAWFSGSSIVDTLKAAAKQTDQLLSEQ